MVSQKPRACPWNEQQEETLSGTLLIWRLTPPVDGRRGKGGGKMRQMGRIEIGEEAAHTSSIG